MNNEEIYLLNGRYEFTVESLRKAIVNKLVYQLGADLLTTNKNNWLNAVLLVLRDIIIHDRIETRNITYKKKLKRVYYLSMEFLMGRTLTNTLLSTHLYDMTKEALEGFKISLEDLIETEIDPALGNGGLGRLAACFIDSLTTLNYPGYGYSIRYKYGVFKQVIQDGKQIEVPDNWIEKDIAWTIARPDRNYFVNYGGNIYLENDKWVWSGYSQLIASAYDHIIPGYNRDNMNTLRLWSAHAASSDGIFDFNLPEFNKGKYDSAFSQEIQAEKISQVLYPDDSTEAGQELRLHQEYFLVSATIQDILRRHKSGYGTLVNLAEKIAIHLNDTHPVLAIPELLRILVDQENFDFDTAWQMCFDIFSYTNHTLMAEALETWSVALVNSVLPRHLQIIFTINSKFLDRLHANTYTSLGFIRNVSIIDEDHGKRVRMAWLAVLGSHKVNGVAKVHSELMKTSVFADFYKLYPERFCNVTNGITPRRWLCIANPTLTNTIQKYIGNAWPTNLNELSKLKAYLHDKDFLLELDAIKQRNKQKLAAYIRNKLKITLDENSFFDVQVKRIHEYKRQFLNLLHIITRYNYILEHPNEDIIPRTFIFAGKAASAYVMAKEIINLINDVGKVINSDPRVQDKIKVVFIPNYGVSLAQLIIPATNLSEQISLAGTEASGTSNMKFSLNGALTIGTLDGANIEILEHVGKDNIFIFGNTVSQVEAIKAAGYNSQQYIKTYPELAQALSQITSGYFNKDDPYRYAHFMNYHDPYQAFADFKSYIDMQHQVDIAYSDKFSWLEKTVLNISNMGYFSSDRAITQYAEEIWHVTPLFKKMEY